jgi:hypothetical protein
LNTLSVTCVDELVDSLVDAHRGNFTRTARYSAVQLLGAAGSRLLERSVAANDRATLGVFFSGSELAGLVARLAAPALAKDAVLADPTCGGGDLLLACAERLPLCETFSQTIAAWSARIAGADINESFAKATRTRLELLAMQRHLARGDDVQTRHTPAFENVAARDFLKTPNAFGGAGVIVSNPPFGAMSVDGSLGWGAGQVQKAAVFLSHLVANAQAEQEIIAVLPEVLRSGSRYERWRRSISESCQLVDLLVYGRFSQEADVDVFVIHLRRDASRTREISADWVGAIPANRPLSEHFNVSIGAVVPHRHEKKGPWAPYLDVKSAPAFGQSTLLKKRRFKGRLVDPPFIVVRRTSSPKDRRRLIPTLVNGCNPVAVENHLIVISPVSGLVSDCEKLIEVLGSDESNSWVNRLSRCRHLSKSLLEQLPLPEAFDEVIV